MSFSGFYSNWYLFLHQTLAAIDKDQMGKVKVEDLRRILDLYCFRLTHDQWRKVKAGLSIGPDNCVDYATFLKNYVGLEVRFEE